MRCIVNVKNYSTMLIKMNFVFFISDKEQLGGIPGCDSTTLKYSLLGTMSRFNHK